MLEVRGLYKHFGGVRAVDGVSLTVKPGECVALIGPNGAGKSTCFACIAGQYVQSNRPSKRRSGGGQAGRAHIGEQSGEITWRGQQLGSLTPAQRLQHGVARTFQVAQVFEALSVLDNVQLAAAAAPAGSAPASSAQANSVAASSSSSVATASPKDAAASTPNFSGLQSLHTQHTVFAQGLLAQTGLADVAQVQALSLPYGAKKRLELAIALAAEPELLLLDEPAAGLAEAERASLMQLVKSLAAQGMAVLYTEHNMDAVAGVADRVLVLMEGQIVAEGSFEEVARDPLVRSRYLGEMGEQAEQGDSNVRNARSEGADRA